MIKKEAEEKEEVGKKKRLRTERTPTSRFGYDLQSTPQHNPSLQHENGNKKLTSLNKTDEKESEEDIATSLDFLVGDEIYFNGRIHDNDGFSGEILSIEEINQGFYKLKMANHCHGLWGDSIKRPASKMKKFARRILAPHDQIVEKKELWFIPIQFTVQSAVFDNRKKKSSPERNDVIDHAAFVNKALDGWHLLDSWRADLWTIDPYLLHDMWSSGAVTYSTLFVLLQDVLEGTFKPHTDDKFDAFFILPPAGGSVQLLKDYIKACERQDEQFLVNFEYLWIFVDKGTARGLVKV